MGNPTTSDVRTTIQISNTTSLPDATITLAISDAVTITGQTDELALRYYACYLISQSWDSTGGMSSADGVSFFQSTPERFLSLYNDRVKQLTINSGDNIGMAKITTNPDLAYDTTYNYLRERNSGDEYY